MEPVDEPFNTKAGLVIPPQESTMVVTVQFDCFSFRFDGREESLPFTPVPKRAVAIAKALLQDALRTLDEA